MTCSLQDPRHMHRTVPKALHVDFRTQTGFPEDSLDLTAAWGMGSKYQLSGPRYRSSGRFTQDMDNIKKKKSSHVPCVWCFPDTVCTHLFLQNLFSIYSPQPHSAEPVSLLLQLTFSNKLHHSYLPLSFNCLFQMRRTWNLSPVESSN